jgi:cold shock protein
MDPDNERESGTVASYFLGKGFGFIVPDFGGNDVFVHNSAVQKAGFDALNIGQRVSYTLVPRTGGRFGADNLRLIEASS